MTKTGRTIRIVCVAIGALVLVATFAAGPAIGQTGGAIEGTVTNGTDQAPAAGIDVSLQLYAAQGDLGVLDGTTDAKGRFSFTDLPVGVAGYQVFAQYKGGEYRAVAQSYSPGVPTAAALTVYEPTTDPGDVTYADYIVWVDQLDNGSFAVQHDPRFANAGTSAYIGDGTSVVTIDLPPGATNPQFRGAFLETPGQI